MSSALRDAIEEGRDELTLEEARAFAEEQAQTYFGMTVAQFIRAAERGDLDEDNPMVFHLALLTGARVPSC